MMNIKVKYLCIIAVVLTVTAIVVAGCTAPAQNAPVPVPVQTTVAQNIQTVVPAAPATPAAEQKPAAGPLGSAIASQIPGQVGQVSASMNASVAGGEEHPTAIGVSIPDLPFSQLYPMSSAQIIVKTDAVMLPLLASSMTFRAGYSPVQLQLAADDLGFTAQQYLDKINKQRGANTEEEQTRITFIKYLTIVKDTGNAIRDAASAENEGNYQQAAVDSQFALTYLEGIKQLPDQSPKSTLNRLTAYLKNYKITMETSAMQAAKSGARADLIQNSNGYARAAA